MNLSTITAIEAETAAVKARRAAYRVGPIDTATEIAAVAAHMADVTARVGRNVERYRATHASLGEYGKRSTEALAEPLRDSVTALAKIQARIARAKVAGITIESKKGEMAEALKAARVASKAAVIDLGRKITSESQAIRAELDKLEAENKALAAEDVAARALLEELEADGRECSERLRKAGCTRAQWPAYHAQRMREFRAELDPLVTDPARRRLLGLQT